MRQREPSKRSPARMLIAIATSCALAAGLLFLPGRTSSTAAAAEPQRRAQQQRRRSRRAPQTSNRVPTRNARDYSRFRHADHRPPVARLDCDSCHTITSPAEPDLVAAATKPSVKGYPYHDSCVSCHRQQFFRGATPAICTVCHTRSSPRLTRRELHAFPKQSEQLVAREFPGYFPHELHQSLIARAAEPAVRLSNAWSAAHAPAKVFEDAPPQALDNCSSCHATDARAAAPLKVGGGEGTLKPEPGTFKVVPTGHASCFNCHWQSQQPTKDECAGCHLSPAEFTKRKRAQFAEAALPGLLSPKSVEWFKTWPRGWPRRLSIKFRHQTENHDIGCTTCHINITQMETLNIPKADVPIETCAPCHISTSPVLRQQGVNLTIFSEMSEEEKDKDNRTNTCIGCHTSLIGRERPPCSHYLILGQRCKE